MDKSTEIRVCVLHRGAIPFLAVWMNSLLFLGGCAPQTGPEQVMFGNQTWMATNLTDTLYRNGDPIPHADWYVYFRGVGTGYTELYQGESSTYYGMSVRLLRD